MQRRDEFREAGAVREAALKHLEENINVELRRLFETHKLRGPEYLARSLVNWVEELVERLNKSGYSFGRDDYGGDIDYERSEQTWSDGEEMGEGVILTFKGFACKVEWREEG